MKPAIILLALTSIAFAQGDLTPPGPPGLTMRSLDEIKPGIPLNQTNTQGDATSVFKITKPGSYFLTGNIKPPAGKNGILIALLLPGVVEVDMGGFGLDGTDAGPTAIGVSITATDDLWQFKMGNGTISNFAGGSCLSPSATGGTIALHDLSIRGGGAGVSTTGSLKLTDILISGVTGIPVQMGSNSTLERVSITTRTAGIPKLISCTGTGYKLSDVIVSSFSFGASHPTAIELGPDSVINGMSVRLSDAIFTGPVLSNTSGFTEVSGLRVELNSVTAPVVSNSFSWGMSQTGILGTTYGGDGFTFQKIESVIAATDCNFSSAIVIIGPGFDSDQSGMVIKLKGSTTTPTVVRVEADNISFNYETIAAATATVSGAVIDIAASGTTTRANIRGGNVGVRLSSGTGNKVEGCNLIGLLVPAVGIQIAGPVTNSLVRNNTATRLAAGGVIVQNGGDASNRIGPVLLTPAQFNANTNPFANIVH